MTLNLEDVHLYLAKKEPYEIVDWASTHLTQKLVMTSSFGIESALTLHVVTQVIPDIPVVHIDTGIPETAEFGKRLAADLNLNVKIVTPITPEEIESVHGRLWEQGPEGLKEYYRIRKIVPMERALRELGAEGVIIGIRADQTENRAAKKHVEIEDGRYKIHPVLRWKQEEFETYFSVYDLPRHPLFDKGYGSVGDVRTTAPGQGRNGRLLGPKMECGLNIQNS